MNSKKFSTAMNEIGDKYINEAIAYKPEAASLRLKRHLPAALIATTLALLLMGAGVVAVIYGDSIQSWFSHYWKGITGQSMTEGQTAVIDYLSQEIDKSQTVDNVTVTVDSATVGDNNFFLLLRVEGMEFSKEHGYGFADINMNVEPDPVAESRGFGGYYGFHYHGLDGDGAVLFLMDAYMSGTGDEQDTSPIDITLTLENLVETPHTDRGKTLVEGQWSFHFSLDRSKLLQIINLPDTEVMVMNLDKQELVPVTITNIELTSTSLRFQCAYAEGTLSLEAHISVVLKDGITIGIGGGCGTLLEDDSTLNYFFQWRVPVNLDEVSAILIGETEIIVP